MRAPKPLLLSECARHRINYCSRISLYDNILQAYRYTMTLLVYTSTCTHSCRLRIRTKDLSMTEAWVMDWEIDWVFVSKEVRSSESGHVRWSCGHQLRQVGFPRVLGFPPHEDHRTQTSVPTIMININCITCFVNKLRFILLFIILRNVYVQR